MNKNKTSLKVLAFISSSYFIGFFTIFVIILAVQAFTFFIELKSENIMLLRFEEIMYNANFPMTFLIMYIGILALLAFTLFKYIIGSKSIVTLYSAVNLKNTVYWCYGIIIICTIGLLWSFQVLSMFICGQIYTAHYKDTVDISLNGIYMLAAMRWGYLHIFFPMDIFDLLRTVFILAVPINVAFWTYGEICSGRSKMYVFVIIFALGYFPILNGILNYESDSGIIMTIIKMLFGIFYIVFPAWQSYLIFKGKEIG